MSKADSKLEKLERERGELGRYWAGGTVGEESNRGQLTMVVQENLGAGGVWRCAVDAARRWRAKKGSFGGNEGCRFVRNYWGTGRCRQTDCNQQGSLNETPPTLRDSNIFILY